MKAVLRQKLVPFTCFALFLGAAACETAKSANPLSPTIAGPIEGVVITQPKLLEPLANQQIKDKDQPFNVIIENPSSTSPRPFALRMQVATDINFSTVVWTRDGIPAGDNGQTRFRMPEKLASGRAYFWRVLADDGANQSAWSAPRGFEVLMPTKFGAPRPKDPVNNEQVSTTRPELRVQNGDAQGPVGQAYYLFQVSKDSAFSSLVVNEQTPQQGGETRLVTRTLSYSTTYYWRVRISDGETTSNWSDIESFRTGAEPPPAPTPGPAPGPGSGDECGAPYPSTPLSIIKCQRSKYGYMSKAQIVNFLIASAKDLTKNGHGGPYGILVKDGGHNCLGFSCDILCTGNGSSQEQWDVLGDAEGKQTPGWSHLSRITVRTCQVQ